MRRPTLTKTFHLQVVHTAAHNVKNSSLKLMTWKSMLETWKCMSAHTYSNQLFLKFMTAQRWRKSHISAQNVTRHSNSQMNSRAMIAHLQLGKHLAAILVTKPFNCRTLGVTIAPIHQSPINKIRMRKNPSKKS